jgi:uncharacterized membrane protein
MLLFLVGLLSLVSGVAKMRIRIRSSAGSSALAPVEIALGAAVVLASAVGLSRSSMAGWVVATVLAVVALSSYRQVRRVVQSERRRRLSEDVRLKDYLKAHDLS